MKTVVFDFDNTLTTYDTIFPFLFYTNKDVGLTLYIKKVICTFLRLCYRLKFISNSQLKDLAVKLLLGNYSSQQISVSAKGFFDSIKFHEAVYQQLEAAVMDNNKAVYISTASFSDYIDMMKGKFPKLIIQASKLRYQDGVIKGLRFNNYGSDKVSFWKNIGIDVFYTDSLSDLPLAEISKNIIHISNDGLIQECSDLEHFIRLCKNQV